MGVAVLPLDTMSSAPEPKVEYRYREGVHGEHCIEVGFYRWIRQDTIGRAATKEDAERIVREMNGRAG